MADPQTRQLGELITTDQQVTPDEQSVLDDWRELVFTGEQLGPEELATASELLARWITVERHQGRDLPEYPTEKDISAFFPPAGLPGTNLDPAAIRGIFELLVSSETEGQTTEDSRQAQTSIDPVMMFNGQFVHTSEDIKLSGAGIDFVAGTARRAPAWISKLGMEWAYRLAQEPRRLAGRGRTREGSRYG